MTLVMGKVKWFDQIKGVGIIALNDGESDVYVSRRAIANSGCKALIAGQCVEFVLGQNSRGPFAKDVIVY